LKDLCARLPYGVKGEKYTIRMDGEFVPLIDVEIIIAEDIITLNGCPGYTIKPYLFPLSSMTDEQKYDFYCRFIENDCDFDDFKKFYLDNGMWYKLLTSLDDIEAIIDWFHKKHFDYRGLIPMGLANDATGLNIY
jgi:hypothetical protein